MWRLRKNAVTSLEKQRKRRNNINLWIGDYLKLRNEIHFLEFKLTDEQLTEKEIEETQNLLNKKLYREGTFKVIVSSFNDIENKILRLRFIEGKTIDQIADEIGYSKGTVYNEHARLTKAIKQFDVIYKELKKFEENFQTVTTNAAK